VGDEQEVVEGYLFVVSVGLGGRPEGARRREQKLRRGAGGGGPARERLRVWAWEHQDEVGNRFRESDRVEVGRRRGLHGEVELGSAMAGGGGSVLLAAQGLGFPFSRRGRRHRKEIFTPILCDGKTPTPIVSQVRCRFRENSRVGLEPPRPYKQPTAHQTNTTSIPSVPSARVP